MNKQLFFKKANFILFLFFYFAFAGIAIGQTGDDDTTEPCPCYYGEGTQFITVGTGTNFPNLTSTPLLGNSYSGIVKVQGTFEVDDDLALLGATVIMCPDAEIKVTENSLLNISVSTVKECVRPWKRILVTTGSKINVQFSTIRLGQKAIELEHWSSIVNIRFTNFINNDIGIYTAPGNFKHVIHFGSILSNNFIGNSTNQVGVELNNTINFRLGTNDVDAAGNTFRALGTGIRINDCRNIILYGSKISELSGDRLGIESIESLNSIIKYSEIQDPRIGINCLGSSISILNNEIKGCEEYCIKADGDWFTPNLFANISSNILEVRNSVNESFATAILSMAHGDSNKKIDILNNTINLVGKTEDSFRGIKSADEDLCVNISGNTITGSEALSSFVGINFQFWGNGPVTKTRLCSNNIIDFSSAQNCTGDGLQTGGEKMEVIANTITGSSESLKDWRADGINANQSIDCIYSCNSVDNIHNGFSARLYPYENTAVQTTTFGRHQYGLHINNAELGLKHYHFGNDWINSDCEIDFARFDLPAGDPDDIFAENRFTSNYNKIPNCDPGTQPPCYDQISVSTGAPQDWFTFSDFQSDMAGCASASGCGGDNPDDPDDDIADRDIRTALLPPGNTPNAKGFFWMKKQNLFRKLSLNSGLLNQNPQIDDFFSNSQQGSLGQFYEIGNAIGELYRPSDTQQITLNDFQFQIENYNAQIEILLEALLLGDEDEEDLINQLETLNAELVLLYNGYDLVINQIKNEALNSIPGLLVENNSISTSEIYQINEQMINEVYLNTVAQGNSLFTDEQKSIISFVSEQCPMSGGFAVDKAREIRNLYENVIYDDDQNCGEVQGKSVVKSTESSIGIYPNPFNNLFTLTLEQPLEYPSEVIIVDVFGKTVLRTIESAGVKRIEIGTEELSSGIYFVQINSNGSKILSEKIIKQ